MADVHVKGLRELQAFLDTLPAKIEKNIMRTAMRAGAKVVKDAAVQNVPVKSGALRKSLKVSTKARGATVSASVRTRVFHAHFIEFGTAAHVISGKNGGWLRFGGGFAKSVYHPGAKARPFLRPALDTQAQAALVAVGEKVKVRLTKQGLDVAHVAVEGDE